MNSFKSAFKEKAKLSALGRVLLRSQNFEMSAKPDEWLEAILTIEKYRRFRNKAAGGMIMLLLLSLIVIIYTLVIAKPIIAICAVLAMIVAIVFLCRLTKVKFNSRSAGLLCPIVATLREDMKHDASLKISLDYSGSTSSKKRKSTRKVPHSELMNSVRSRTEYFYEDSWLVIRGKLIDQTGFQILCRNDTREAKTVKLSASGKTKYKRKTKHKATQMVTLKPAASARQVSAPLAAGYPTVIKEREGGFTIIATNQFSGQRKPEVPNANADLLLDLFACTIARYH